MLHEAEFWVAVAFVSILVHELGPRALRLSQHPPARCTAQVWARPKRIRFNAAGGIRTHKSRRTMPFESIA